MIIFAKRMVIKEGSIRESPRENAVERQPLFILSFFSFSDDDSTVMVTGKAKDLESWNSKIHPQLRCALLKLDATDVLIYAFFKL